MTCWLYVIMCRNGCHYTGVTKNLSARYYAHSRGRGALYTKMNGVESLLYAVCLPTRSYARRLEIKFKRMSHQDRETYLSAYAFIKTNGETKLLCSILSPELCIGGGKAPYSIVDLTSISPCISMLDRMQCDAIIRENYAFKLQTL